MRVGGRRRREAGAAGAAAGLAMGGYVLAALLRGAWPPGAATAAVPFQTRLWDLLHGRATGDGLFNWSSGYGAPFLADLFGHLMNPLSWPAALLLPRDQARLAVFLVVLGSIGLATALMTVALGRLHPGPAPLRALLAVGYGLCAWVLAEGAAAPMWLWGLVSLPLLCLVGDWCLHERRWVLGTLCVAAAWAGNLYTAAPATIAAGAVLLARMLSVRRPAGARIRVAGRAVTSAAVGIMLSGPVLLVAAAAARDARPDSPAHPLGPSGLGGHLAQLLPGTRGGHPLPDVAVGLLGLLLVAALPFHRRVRVRERAAWCGLLVLAALSYGWTPTVLLWHGLAVPVGAPYRESFALSGLLVLAAWVSLAHRPDRTALLGAGAVVLLLTAIAAGTGAVPAWIWAPVVLGGAVVLGALWALERWHTRRREVTAATAVLGAAVLAGAVWSAYAAWAGAGAGQDSGPAVRAGYAALRAADDWPRGRGDPGPHRFTPNDPLLLDGEGGGYASGFLPDVTALLLRDLGAGWADGGRSTASFPDPVGRALFGVRTYLADGPGPDGFTVGRATAPPLVTVLPHGPAPDASSVWSRRESLLGSRVYDVPAPVPSGEPAPVPAPGGGWAVPATPAGAEGGVLTADCPAGSEAYFDGIWFDGTVEALGTAYRSDGAEPVTAVPLHLLGEVPADGRVRVLLRARTDTRLPDRPIGCLRPGALAAAVTRLTATGATRIGAGGHVLTAELPPGSTGTALLSVPATEGWSCSADRRPYAQPQPVLGLIGVPLGTGTGRVTCAYRPPGLTEGLTVGLAAAGVTVITAVFGPLRHRPTRTPRRTRRRAAAGRPATGGGG
ncbi:YfhO family protein [Kitasatospora sp. NPDC004240]